jgi:hypothetical protein
MFGAMRESMEIYSRTAAERAMKLQEVLLRATAGKIKWWQVGRKGGQIGGKRRLTTNDCRAAEEGCGKCC